MFSWIVYTGLYEISDVYDDIYLDLYLDISYKYMELFYSSSKSGTY